MIFSSIFPGRRILAALATLLKGQEAMALDLTKLTSSVADLKAAVVAASAALDDIAAKLAAASGGDTATLQAAVDQATADIESAAGTLTASVAKDDAPPAAPASPPAS